jgi:NAD-dependent dihydropyrimidine dehydrogenase PreA subunit
MPLPSYRAVIDTEKCTASGECIKICEVKAIYEGPKRLPKVIACACQGDSAMPELLPGKSVVNYDKCNGCGDCIAVCPSHAIEMVPVSEAYG